MSTPSNRRIRKGSHKREKFFGTQHRYEHWYVDNMVYFITARCRHGTHAFLNESCKTIFLNQFDRYSKKHNFTPFLTSLLSNHYHTLGYLKCGNDLPRMMRGIHGAVAKLVNDELDVRLVPFWIDAGQQNYFDGCIRDEKGNVDGHIDIRSPKAADIVSADVQRITHIPA